MNAISKDNKAGVNSPPEMTTETPSGITLKRSMLRRILFAGIYTSVFLAILVTAAISYVVYDLGPVKLQKSEELSVVVLDRRGRLLRPYTTSEGIWRLPVELKDIDPKLVKMLLTYEDKRFYQHYGVDVLALLRGGWLMAKHGRIISGGSTITMQVARLLEGQKSRSFYTKLKQIVRAVQLEQRFTKQEILKLYFTLAPYGGNIEGVRAASLAYFGREPKRLSPQEIALLIALPQAPRSRRLDRHPENAKRGRDWVLSRMVKNKVLSKSDMIRAKKYPVPAKRFDFPMHAAHLADTIVAKAPKAQQHKLTIDRELQANLEKLVKTHAGRAGPKLSASLLIADHKTGNILVYIGSPGYLNTDRFGSIDMIQAVRSPGSALKPFIYGFAFERGLVHPETMIEDAPIRYGNYSPENFDKVYRGALSIRQALQVSLNTPVVKLLAELGPSRLASKFKVAGLKTKIPRNLSIALGGVGIKLQDMAQLYTALPRGGRPIALRYQPDQTDVPIRVNSPPLLSETASWYVTDILRGVRPPKNSKGGEIAFKTGTSYGNRDAWSVGYDGRHLAAAWIGRPDNTATPGLAGLKSAAPLLFDAFQRISPKRVPFKGTPTSALQAQNSQLPPPLQHFDKRMENRGRRQAGENVVRITFPPNESRLELLKDDEGGKLPIALKAQGGTLPLTWLVDGKPIKSRPRKRETFWHPEGLGFVKLTVVDANGKVDRIGIRVVE